MKETTGQFEEVGLPTCSLYQEGFTGNCECCGQRVECILLSILRKVQYLEKITQRVVSHPEQSVIQRS